MLAKLLTAAAVASLAATPVLASPASSLSLSQARVATKGKNQNEFAPAVIIGVLATVAIIGGAVVLANSDDSPDSP
ncbi:hypothetical protein [Sphingomonas soli]|uniref:hypothetical protein n=1 Tax=Sphingomonas soli TaxID=266127 RepID=UPI00082D3D55|nr:hypothetical protein [Sphingomonas soli]